MGAVICLTELGFDFQSILSALRICMGVPGRVEIVPTETEYTVIIDYAHTPDGLENVINAMREVSEARIITVFGCGGDRDSTKRPIMGKIAGDLSDVAVVTSDNPRTENPDSIIDQIVAGMDGCKAKIVRITDRTEAIRYALNEAKKDDVVLLCGKGHETYQVLAEGKIHYDEREIVKDILNETQTQ
jgi:UDP-N-acetylmuramoyl-L-alanyl-D-glutamate--2,6-diaminopimelate ligase